MTRDGALEPGDAESPAVQPSLARFTRAIRHGWSFVLEVPAEEYVLGIPASRHSSAGFLYKASERSGVHL